MKVHGGRGVWLKRGRPIASGLSVLICIALAWAGYPTMRRAQAQEGPSTPAPSDGRPQVSSVVVWPGFGVVTPLLLVQTDAVVLRHGADRPVIEDGLTHPGLYLRRARVGADFTAGLLRARLAVDAASRTEVADQSRTGVPTGGGSAAAVPATLGGVAGQSATSGTRITEAYVAYAPSSAFIARAGSLRVPLGLSRQIDEADLRLPERPRFVVRNTPDFRVGAAANGDLGLLQYAVGTYAASAQPDVGYDHGGALHLLRLGAEPLGPMGVAPQLRRPTDPWYGWWRFSLGLSAFYAHLPGSNEKGVGGDTQVQWRRLCITSELLWIRRAGIDRLGFDIEPGVFLIPARLEVVARLDWYNNDIGPASLSDAWGVSLGTTLFSPARRVRVQAAYTWRRLIATAVTDNRPTGWAVLRLTFVL